MAKQVLGDQLCKHLKSIGVRATLVRLHAPDRIDLLESVGVKEDFSDPSLRANKIELGGIDLDFIVAMDGGSVASVRYLYVAAPPQPLQWPASGKRDLGLVRHK